MQCAPGGELGSELGDCWDINLEGLLLGPGEGFGAGALFGAGIVENGGRGEEFVYVHFLEGIGGWKVRMPCISLFLRVSFIVATLTRMQGSLVVRVRGFTE